MPHFEKGSTMSKIHTLTEIRTMAFADPTVTTAAIRESISERGGTPPSVEYVDVVRKEFINTMKFLHEKKAFNGHAPATLEVKTKKEKKQSRADRWADACAQANEALAELKELQEEYEGWKDSLPENLANSPVGEKLTAVCDLDIESAMSTVDDAEGAELPLGFGRD